ncbi:peptidase C15, pyroglutamyl peptidase I-like protein [Serendipita vermifera]|nr:peptidase C15, pyroglutamyl peptidase I-like protein [Serendipita vermifera]
MPVIVQDHPLSEDATPSPKRGGISEDRQVVVTGFGPFGNITINPSFEIARRLPAELAAEYRPQPIPFKFFYNPEPVEVAWTAVLATVTSLYDQFTVLPSSDSIGPFNPLQPIFIHIGAGYYGKYTLEKLAHRDGYFKTDTRKEHAPIQKRYQAFSAIEQGQSEQQPMAENDRGYPIIDENSPVTISTGIDVEGVVKDVKKELTTLSMPIEPSDDAGRFLCDFIYYSSLREALVRYGPQGVGRVLFVHVPPDGTIEEGVQVLKAVIKSLVRRTAAV